MDNSKIEISEEMMKKIQEFGQTEAGKQFFEYVLHPIKDGTCLHESCTICGGTGNRKDGLGMCIHHIACPCAKCSPRC